MSPMTPARLPSPSTVWRCAAMRMRRGCTASAAMHTGNAARIRCMTRWTAPGTACRDAQCGRRLRGVWRLRRLHGQRAGADEHAGQAWHQTVENGYGWRAINYWISTVASPHACDGLIAQAKKMRGAESPRKNRLCTARFDCNTMRPPLPAPCDRVLAWAMEWRIGGMNGEKKWRPKPPELRRHAA